MPKSKEMKTIRPIKGYTREGKPVSITNYNKYKGIYAIGIDDPDPKKAEKTVVRAKIGLGGLTKNEGGLYPRIRSYYICFPDGVWEYALLLSLENDAKLLKKIEKDIHTILAKKRYKSKYLTNLKESEWFQASIKQIRDAFKKVNDKYPDQTFVIFPSEYEEDEKDY